MPLAVVVIDADGEADEYNAIGYERDEATGVLKIKIDREQIVELEPYDYAGGPLFITDDYDGTDSVEFMQ